MAKITLKKYASLKKGLGSDWQTNDIYTELSLTANFKNHFTAFMFLTKVSIHAEVKKYYPTLILKEHTVKITLGSKKSPLTTDDFNFAFHVDVVMLSTKERRQVSTLDPTRYIL